MPYMIGKYDDVVRTKYGHVVSFQKGVEVFVPDQPEVVKECKKRGHAVKQAVKPTPKPPPRPVQKPAQKVAEKPTLESKD